MVEFPNTPISNPLNSKCLFIIPIETPSTAVEKPPVKLTSSPLIFVYSRLTKLKSTPFTTLNLLKSYSSDLKLFEKNVR